MWVAKYKLDRLEERITNLERATTMHYWTAGLPGAQQVPMRMVLEMLLRELKLDIRGGEITTTTYGPVLEKQKNG